MTEKKTRVLVLSDDIRSSSGVAHQTRNMIEGLLKTGKYQFYCLAGAIKHPSYELIKFNEYGDDLILHPVDGYGNETLIRSVIMNIKPDVLWFMTDPRFYEWLWMIANEVRCNVPMIYYHVWDNYPVPDFNKKWYLSNDVICSISKLTDDIVNKVAPEVTHYYLPHAYDTTIFKPLSESENSSNRRNFLKIDDKKFVVFWNNRNARRKQSGTLIYFFNKFLDRVGRDKATLLMHTDPNDPYGQPLQVILNKYGLTNGEVLISANKVTPQELNMLYNASDVTVSISDAEGHGLSISESLLCEKPVICTKTGGMTDQATDGVNVFGELLEPAAQSLIGGHEVPYIFEDRVSEKDFVDALERMYNLSKEDRLKIGKLGREHVLKNFELNDSVKKWNTVFQTTVEECGSWPNKKYQRYTVKVI